LFVEGMAVGQVVQGRRANPNSHRRRSRS
jgi:hypothetical protein